MRLGRLALQSITRFRSTCRATFRSGRSGRSGSVVAAVVVCAVVIGSAAGVSAESKRQRPAVIDTASLPGVRATARTERLRQAKIRAWRKSPAGRRARKRSRKAFRGLDRRSALRIARTTFKRDVKRPAWRGPKLKTGERLKGYLDYNTALIEADSGDALARASFPLVREDGLAVDMQLVERDGGLEPEAPLVPLRIARSPRTGAVVGRSGIGIAPADGRGDQALIVEDKLFYANVATDLDLIVEPTLTGVRSSFQLRSPASPDPALDLRLPRGAKLKLASADARPGSAEIVKAEDRLAVIDAPSAMDADGQPVPVRYRIDKDRLVVEVSSDERPYRWPILVDPDAHVWEDFRGWPDMRFWESVPNGRWAWGPRNDTLLSSAALGDEYNYQVGQYHQWRWPTTGGSSPPVAQNRYANAFVFRADVSVDYKPNGTNLQLGFWPDQGWTLGQGAQLAGYTDTLCINNFCGGANNGAFNGTDGNWFFHSLVVTQPGWRWGADSELNYALLYLHERHPPRVGSTTWTINGANHDPNRWVGGATSLKASTPATDEGLGLRQGELVWRDGGQLVIPATPPNSDGTRKLEGCFAGVQAHDTTPGNTPWGWQTDAGPDQGDRNNQCPLSTPTNGPSTRRPTFVRASTMSE